MSATQDATLLTATAAPGGGVSMGCILAAAAIMIGITLMVRMENPPLTRLEWFGEDNNNKKKPDSSNPPSSPATPEATPPTPPKKRPAVMAKPEAKPEAKRSVTVVNPMKKDLPKRFKTAAVKQGTMPSPKSK